MAEKERNGYLFLEIACALYARSMRATCRTSAGRRNWLGFRRSPSGRRSGVAASPATTPMPSWKPISEKGGTEQISEKGVREKGDMERISYFERHLIHFSSSTSELLSEVSIRTLVRTCELAPKRWPCFGSINGRQSTRASAMFSTLQRHGPGCREAGLQNLPDHLPPS